MPPWPLLVIVLLPGLIVGGLWVAFVVSQRKGQRKHLRLGGRVQSLGGEDHGGS